MADGLEKLLGKTGIDVVTRLLGMLLAALSVQFVLEGFFAFLPANRRSVRTGDWEQLFYYGILLAALLGGVLLTRQGQM